LAGNRSAQAVEADYTGPPCTDDPAWTIIRRSAENFVHIETSSAMWPCEVPRSSQLVATNKRVWAHYFPPFPLSIDNKPTGSDTYKTELLSRSGQQGRFYSVGGLLRDRPLPVPSWPSPYWREINYAIEIFRARAAGLDGFCADILTFVGPLWDRVKTLFAVTDSMVPDFHLILVPDMNAMRTVSMEQLTAALQELAAHKSAYRLADGRLVIAPYNAELKPPEFWRELVLELQKRGSAIALWPIFLNEPLYERRYPEFGMPYANWVHPDIIPSTESLQSHERKNSGSSLVMDGISPQHVAPKSSTFREAENTELFRTGWQHAIERNLPNVQLVSWNDYTEGTQVSPSVRTQFVFYDLCLYHSLWFKTGKAPVISRDAIYYCHRTQIIRPESRPTSGEEPMHLIGNTPLHNEIEMLAFLTTRATLHIMIAGRYYEQAGTPGLTVFHAPAAPGRPIFRIIRGDQTIVEKASDWVIATEFSSENPEYVGGSSTRPFVPGL